MTSNYFFQRLMQILQRRRDPVKKRGEIKLGAAATPHARDPFVVVPPEARPQHLGIIGLSGSGKTYFIEHLIRQDIQHETGFVLFDVHGDLADNVIRYLAERASANPTAYERTVILEPFDPERSFGFNPLQQTEGISPFHQAREFAYILRKRWSETLIGPRTEELLQQSLYTLAVSGQTILRLPLLLTSKNYRHALVAKVPSDAVRQFWQQRYDRLSEKMQAVVREPILTRLSSFITDPQMRDIVGQSRSTFSFREAMQKGLWVICNVSQGRLGEQASILGSILFTKLELEVMALANVPENQRRLFVVYADELQNFTSDTFSRLIAEARKYSVSLVTGHQYWRQLDPALRHAMLAVGTKVFFRVHYHDAVELAGELAADERNRYTKLLTILERGEAVVRVGRARPVVITIPAHQTPKPSAEEVSILKEASARRHMTPRSRIHQEEPLPGIERDRGNAMPNREELT